MSHFFNTADAVLLIGHGTRSRKGQKQFLSLAAELRERLERPLEPAFLELAEPTIDQALARLVAGQIERLIVAPLLLFAAGHAKEDIPRAVRQALERLGRRDLALVQCEPFGCEPRIVELAHQRLVESLAGRGIVPRERTLLVAVGRGSSDSAATAEMLKFAGLLGQRAGIRNVQVAFLAMARPTLAEALAAVDGAASRVIVQPHLLFDGELVERLTRQMSEFARGRPQEWVMTGVLAPFEEGGDGGLLTAATVDIIQTAARGDLPGTSGSHFR